MKDNSLAGQSARFVFQACDPYIFLLGHQIRIPILLSREKLGEVVSEAAE
jgi:hypothetical protein